MYLVGWGVVDVAGVGEAPTFAIGGLFFSGELFFQLAAVGAEIDHAGEGDMDGEVADDLAHRGGARGVGFDMQCFQVGAVAEEVLLHGEFVGGFNR